MTGTPRYAIVTPYYREPRDMLERCLASVRAQGVKVTHILVADGHPQPWLEQAGVRHISIRPRNPAGFAAGAMAAPALASPPPRRHGPARMGAGPPARKGEARLR